MGAWKAALGASAVFAAGAGALAAPAAGATAPPVERASATAVAILTPARPAASGTPSVFAWETPVAMRGYRFPDELPAPGRYEVGSLAMANAGPDTNGSQFFVISGPDGMRLPPQYSLFGKVVKGLDVVDAMQSVPTGARDKPVEDVVIRSVTITED